MNYFPKLEQREVTLELPDGRKLEIKLLPVRMLDRYFTVLSDVADHPTPEMISGGRIRLREIVQQVWPQDKLELLYHFDYIGMTKLTQYLFFGDTESHSGKGKRELSSGTLPDMEFIAAKILNTIPSYTLETLLNEPVPVFFRLSLLSSRIQADHALSMVAAIAAGLGDRDMAKSLRDQRGRLTVALKQERQTAPYTDQDYAEAVKRMQSAQTIIQSGYVGGIIK